MEFPIIIWSEKGGLQYVCNYVDLKNHAPYTIIGANMTPATWQLANSVQYEIKKAQEKLPWYKRAWPDIF